MKQRHLLLVLFVLLGWTQTWADVVINETNFPDANFRNSLLIQDFGSDGVITDAEIATITELYVSSQEISNLQGIEFFTELTELRCDNNKLTTLDLSKNTKLVTLIANNNLLTAIDVTKNTALTTLRLSKNQLTTLDVTKNTALEKLHCNTNQLTAIDLSKNTKLTGFFIDNNQLTTLDLSNCPALIELECDNNQLTAINLSNCVALKELDLNDNQLSTLDVTKCKELKKLNCSGNQLTALDVTMNTALTKIDCTKNLLTAIDVTKNTALSTFNCGNNQLKALDVSKNEALTRLKCANNQLTTLDASKNTELLELTCEGNQLTALYAPQNTKLNELNCFKNQIKGEAMDAFIASLPQQTVHESYDYKGLYVIYNQNEGNVMTTTQAAAAKAKGWIPYYYDGTEWQEYAGSEPAAIEPITEETTVSFGGTSGVDESTDLSNTAVNDVLYTLDNTAGNGYDNTDQSITITSVVSDADIAEAEALTPGTPEFAAKFNGMTIELTAGEGSVTFDCQTIGNRVLTVKMGTAPAATYTKSERGEVKVAYNVAAPTYMYVYATAVAGARGSEPTAIENALKLYGFTVKPGDTTGIGAINSDKPIDGSDVYFDLSGRRVMTPQKGVYVKNGQKVVVK